MAGDSTTNDRDDCTGGGDPRCSGEYVRVIEGNDGTSGSDGEACAGDGSDRGDVTLVGVVHDHPASAHRARAVAATVDPDVLALELPPLAVPLFVRYASAGAARTAGGEMSAAIRASDPDRTAGIDGPTPGFALRLAGQLREEGAALATVRTTASRFLRASGHAVACRLAASLAAVTGRTPDLSAPRDHGVTADDPPDEQASDERRQVRLARSVAAAFGEDRAVATRDATREAHMAERLSALARDGDVVAVVGIDHLDPVARRLGGSDGTGDSS